MAVAANFLAPAGHVLIVAPSTYLTFQLHGALVCSFWDVIKAQPSRGPKPTIVFTPTVLRDLEEFPREPCVWVCTTTTLQLLHAAYLGESGAANAARWAECFGQLLELIEVVLVDEGHREPAKEWARAVRRFGSPTILFSATPYRNDLRFFRVGRDSDRYQQQYRFHTAVSRRTIRDVRFVPALEAYSHPPEDDLRRPRRLLNSARHFSKQLLDFYESELLPNLPADVVTPRVIVRCETGAAVEAVKDSIERELVARNAGVLASSQVLAVHDRFKASKAPNEYPSVPRRESLGEEYPDDAVYWVHQYKLTEGLDDRDFCAVAFFQRFKNSRGLVQQVGRILRNPGRGDRPALVFHDPRDDLGEEFEGYRSFERAPRSIVGPEEIVFEFAKALPDWFYFGGRYREAIDYGRGDREYIEDVIKGLRVRKTALVFRSRRGPTESELKSILLEYSEALEEKDSVEIGLWSKTEPSHQVGVVLHCRIEQTPYLCDRAFFDISLSPSVFYWRQGFFFLQGSSSAVPTRLVGEVKPVEPHALEALLPPDVTRFTQVSLTNCDLGRSSLRRRAIAAYALEDIAPGLGDHFQFASAAVGSVHESGVDSRRYLGFTRSRVTQPEAENGDIAAFMKWADSLVGGLRKPPDRSHPVLQRFAQYVSAGEDEQARHILLEFDEFFNVYQSGLFGETFSSLAADVDPDDGTFSCQVGDREILGKVKYRRGRFYLESRQLDEDFEPRDENVRLHPTTFLTQRAHFRVVTSEGKLYADGRFYLPRTPLWENGRLEDLGIFHSVPSLGEVTKKEKGGKGKFSRLPDEKLTWEEGSVFHVIDADPALFEAADFNPDLLVCDDLGTELADFFALDLAKGKICQIHAKAYGGDEAFSAGASPFHDVHAQVVKNLEYLNPVHTVAPDRSRRWNGVWKWNKKSKQGVRRIRRAPAGFTGARIADEVNGLVRSVETQKEVWVVLGKGFAVKELLAAVGGGKVPDYHSVQLLYLLQSCNDQVSAVGAKLRVFTVDTRPGG